MKIMNYGEKLAQKYPKTSRRAFVWLCLLDILHTLLGRPRVSYSLFVDSYYMEHYRMEKKRMRENCPN